MKKLVVLTAVLVAGMSMNASYEVEADTAVSMTVKDPTTEHVDVRPGKKIRQVNHKGYTLTYHLLDLSERGEMVTAMGHHSALGISKSPDVTNHLMVYIQKPGGQAVPGDVAYLMTGPDGKDFRTMTMGMYSGYGADVVMKLRGAYTITTKIITEGKDGVRIDDEFIFLVK